jgi:pyrroline-5-carboxylate reductase
MVDGLLDAPGEALSISVSPRNVTVAARLAERHTCIKIAASNQDVLDTSDIVVLAVRPTDARQVLASLKFRSDHHVISVIAGLRLSEATALVAPAAKVTLAIPLPAIARGDTPTVITPPDHRVAQLFGRTGAVIQVTDETAYAALGTCTAIMATHFALANSVSKWLVEQGVPNTDARQYVTSLLKGLARTAELDPNSDYERLARDHATPGSFNDYLLKNLLANGSFTVLANSLDVLRERMLGGR